MGRTMAAAIHVAMATSAMAIITGIMVIIGTVIVVAGGAGTIEGLCSLGARQFIVKKVR